MPRQIRTIYESTSCVRGDISPKTDRSFKYHCHSSYPDRFRNFDSSMTDEYYMMLALKEARRAFDEDEIPIGALIVLNEKIIARGYNMTEKLNDPTAHAEMIAMTSAFGFLGSKYLPEATIYITVEPCLMCAGGLYWSKIAKIVYGADDDKNGYKRIAGANWPFHPKTELIRGVMKEECAQLMKDFFQKKR